jgi:Vps51/Vps67
MSPPTKQQLPLQPRMQTNYAQNIAKSMTIDEMRQLHQRALSEAEAKQTELRLVLASRYRELVGSSDEVTKMRERAEELHNLVHALPTLMSKLIESSTGATGAAATNTVEPNQEAEEESKTAEASDLVLSLRHQLALLPRIIHRALDANDVHDATRSLMDLFRLIAEQTEEYPLATTLARGMAANTTITSIMTPKVLDPLLQAQMRMVFLHAQTLPTRITRIATHILSVSASYRGGNSGDWDPAFGAQRSAAALSSLDLLDITPRHDRIVQLLDLYFNSKAQLLKSLLNKLLTSNSSSSSSGGGASSKAEATVDGGAHNAEAILSKIVLILQYDIIVHPYEIFVLRSFPCTTKSSSTADDIVKTLPMFPAELVQSKASKFLAAHLPLIRTKVKSVLVDIAGTTASALGKIRQSLYDKTDGAECMERLDKDNVCTWAQAVNGMVDVQTVLSSGHHGIGGGHLGFANSTSSTQGGNEGVDQVKFSLWSVLFSNTFSSLVHSLLTTSFHSVHSKVVSSLRLSLANAPPLSALLPHEAYRNTLHIASELDTALLKVSEDAHELLVHAEERVESERRLRQSLYVQTCEIMGRLICELRRMLSLPSTQYDNDDRPTDAVKELIVGRLCHLLKFRLTALSTLLNPNSSPAVLHGTSGMISLLELSSAFDLADDNEDGLITFEEAMEAVGSAYSGSQFHGAEMVRETLLLSPGGNNDKAGAGTGSSSSAPPLTTKSGSRQDVTLNELVLLAARGLRHEESGRHSALGTIQDSLDKIIAACFRQWSIVGLSPSIDALSNKVEEFVKLTVTCSESEYQRIYTSEHQAGATSSPVVGDISPHVVAYLLETSNLLNRSVCPSDSLFPVPSKEYAAAMGIGTDDLCTMMDVIRGALLRQSLEAVVSTLRKHVSPAMSDPAPGSPQYCLRASGPSGLVQLGNDLSYFSTCFFEHNRFGFGLSEGHGSTNDNLILVCQTYLNQLQNEVERFAKVNNSTRSEQEAKRKYVFEVCALFLAPLLGEVVAPSTLGDLDTMDFNSSGYGGLGEVRSGADSLLHAPLPSSCRFSLLPVQADRTLSDVQLRGKYNEGKEENERRRDTTAAGVMSSGLGFFSSILKTN